MDSAEKQGSSSYGEMPEYQLDSCVKFLRENKSTRTVLQLKKDALTDSADIVDYIRKQFGIPSSSNEFYTNSIDTYVTRSNTCCVDLLVTQHLTDADAIIHFGNLCLSQPDVIVSQLNLPILCVFGHQTREQTLYRQASGRIEDCINKLLTNAANEACCVFYDTGLLDYAVELVKRMCLSTERLELAKLLCPNPNWKTTERHSEYFIYKQDINDTRNIHGHFVLSKPIIEYTCALYLGTCPQLNLILNGPPKFTRMNCTTTGTDILEQVNLQRLLGRRIAMIARIKDYEDLKIGVLITNPLPNVRAVMQRLEASARHRKHTLYFISMIQTIDECKIGNFDLCDGFVVVNSCHCSTILESLHFNRPIMTETEFQIACGIETKYGGVLWPGSQTNASNLTCDDLINKRKVSDVSMALIQTRNELLERCNQANRSRWSGLEYDTTSGSGEESLDIEEGLKGIASSYSSEPLKPSKND